MAKDDIFLKLGFEVVDTAEPDFHLLVLKLIPVLTIQALKRSYRRTLKGTGRG
jgi:hypothetical protein